MQSNENRLPAPVAENQSENWYLIGLLNLDAYSSGVEESNSNPIMNTNYM